MDDIFLNVWSCITAGSTLTAKGQATVPAEIRALVGARPGTCWVCPAMPDGTIFVRAGTRPILEPAGMLEASGGTHVGLDDMNARR